MAYAPDDAGLTPALLDYLLATPALLAAAEAVGATPAPKDIARLRRDYAAPAVRAALAVAQARRKARDKFPGLTPFWGVPEALEQATSLAVARHKAARFEAAGVKRVADICCGIGGDALALAQRMDVLAIDMSPARLWCLMQNAATAQVHQRITPLCQEVDPEVRFLATAPVDAFHIDPARRSAGKRTWAYGDMIPGPEVIDRLIATAPAGAVKLSPAVDFASLPPGHLELISSDGTVAQAVLWTGRCDTFPSQSRTATVLRKGQIVSFTASPDLLGPPTSDPLAFLYEIDGAVHRAGLAAAFTHKVSARPVSADGGYVTSANLVQHAALAAFAHVETVAFDEKKITDALRRLTGPAGPVEVKTRGGLDVPTDALQRRLSAVGRACSVLIYRAAGGFVVASICRRLPPRQNPC